jgi:hypothetical protein
VGALYADGCAGVRDPENPGVAAAPAPHAGVLEPELDSSPEFPENPLLLAKGVRALALHDYMDVSRY